MRHNPPIVPVVIVAEVISPGAVMCRLMGCTDLILLRMLVETLSTSVRGVFEAPFVDDLGTSFDAAAVELHVAVPGDVR